MLLVLLFSVIRVSGSVIVVILCYPLSSFSVNDLLMLKFPGTFMVLFSVEAQSTGSLILTFPAGLDFVLRIPVSLPSRRK